MQLEFFFMEESAKINALDPSVSKENFGSLCKIDFVGLNHVLEHIGAFTVQLGYIIEPPRQTCGDKSGVDAFEAMSRLNERCMKIFNRLVQEIETMNIAKDHLGVENESFSLNSTLAILRFRQHCVACEWQAKISPYRLEFAMMRLIHSLHEVTFLHQGFKGELAFSFFETSCNKQIELIEQRSGVGKEYLQEVLTKFGETEAQRFAKQIKAFLIIKRQMKVMLKNMRRKKQIV